MLRSVVELVAEELPGKAEVSHGGWNDWLTHVHFVSGDSLAVAPMEDGRFTWSVRTASAAQDPVMGEWTVLRRVIRDMGGVQ